ncbi:hypothetical protein L2010_01130 [Lactobacillus mulieris]|jgi:thioesterase superfamily protein|uniref:acyl-CoA thioesterase n=1 Tax=Lactobacillus mulieris TaxID=2508708 RepID=UPI001247C44B|nr:hotdog domain-containing protein [Lactobacillus mulieris]KAA9244035.1 hypothetical protein F6I33_05245 [Lactobacillus jensenii]MCW8124240.1 hypothetical protein [Lactobacillus mulieris]MCZ9599400.1 hypothetical protein [Lactobacillus mulieris]MDK7327455.1 hotdog domain-containing protein [Lactobacillus mulieris]
MSFSFYKCELGDFVVTPGMLNHLGILHGGKLVKHLDSSLGIFVSRYNGTRCVTGRIDQINFLKRSYVGDCVYFEASILKTSFHTITVYSAIKKRRLNQESELIGEAVFTFVAVTPEFALVPMKPFVATDECQNQFISEKLAQFRL